MATKSRKTKKTYSFYGALDTDGRSELVSKSVATVTHAITYGSRDRNDSKLQTIDLDDGEIVEVQLDAVVLLMSVGELNNFASEDASRGDGPLMLPDSIDVEDDSRGPASMLIRVLRVLGINLPAKAINLFAAKIENQLDDRGPGLYKVAEDGALQSQTLPVGTKPVLLLLHGTASSTANAFSSVLPINDEDDRRYSPDRNRRWQELYEWYEGRVYALEQKTLTESPIANVLDFLDAWRSDSVCPLVILSHSRGGIVGDYISALADWEKGAPVIIDALPADSVEKEQLLELQTRVAEIPAENRPKVDRHIRVGAPGAGTTLASDKTHIWLSVLSNVSGHIPVVGTVIGGIGDLAAAIAKETLLEPGTLPGIDAQKNDSLLVRSAQFLRCHNTALFAITGNSRGILKKALSVIFPGDNDLVVDTDSMLLGPTYGSRRHLPIDDDITHISYFVHRDVERYLNDALTGKQPAKFELLESSTTARGHISAVSAEENVGMPCVFLLPGIMGSELSIGEVGDECDIWLDAFQLFLGRGKKLNIDNTDVRATGVLERGYEGFVEHVRDGGRAHIVPFGYDWRQTLFHSVDEFEKQINQRIFVAPSQPIILVCHSMGGLVARAWRVKYPNTWGAVVAGGGRMIQLGTPNYGSMTIVNIMRGKEKILSMLALVDVKNKESDWLKIINRFPGLLELSDFDQPNADLKKPAVWKNLGSRFSPTAVRLKSAAKVREELSKDKFEKDRSIIYVAGQSKFTPSLNDKDKDNPHIENLFHAGDGRVLWPKGPSKKNIDYYMPAVHGNLLDTPRYFGAVLELALSGKTNKLKKEKPAISATRSAGTPSSVAQENTRQREYLFPTQREFEAAAIGGSGRTLSSAVSADASLTLSVTHGNLNYCDAPVLVGHYIGDGIWNAERALDKVLNGTLTTRWALGPEFYAGKVGSHEVALKHGPKLVGTTGAIVVGLGRMGELQKGDLITSVRNGVLKYAQVCEERGDDCRNLKIASLLIGSGQEALELLDVLDGIVQGVLLANALLKSSRTSEAKTVRISSIEFIEWHLDVAIAARHMLDRLPSSMSSAADILPGIHETDGGHTRAYLRNNSDWWESIRIKMEEQEADENPDEHLTTLSYSVLGGNALGKAAQKKFLRREIDASLMPLLSQTHSPNNRAAISLYEQLVPDALKPLAAQRRNLIVNVDPASAYLPWEILVDRSSSGSEPLAVAAGLVRRIVPDAKDAPASHVNHAEENHALVIGNPPGGPSFKNLSSAFEESIQISDVLRESGWEVNDEHQFENSSSDRQTAPSIRQDILANNYRILHFAAHGVHQSNNPVRTGVVIGYDKKTDTPELFAPHHVESIRNRPSLVFVNCCHTGKVENWHAHRLSASLAAEFIKAGVHCFIGAGWAVSDAAAKMFATTVYKYLLQGENFGYAVRRARESVYHGYPRTNSWAAFQCYGNPGYILVKRVSAGSFEKPLKYFHVSELLHALSNLRGDLKSASGTGVKVSDVVRRANRLFNYSKTVTDDNHDQLWSDRGDVLTHMAAIYCDAVEGVRADDFLDRATKADRSTVKLEDLLMVANYQARRAAARIKAAQESKSNKSSNRTALKNGREDLESALETLERYVELHQDANTLEHLASGYKLLAMTGAKRSRKSNVRKMTQWYDESARLEQKNAYYPGSNALLGYVLLKKGTQFASAVDKDRAEKLIDIINRSLEQQTGDTFWSIISSIDVEVVYALNLGNFDKKFGTETVARIKAVAKAFPSDSELDSVKKQYRFIETLSDNKSVCDVAREIYKALENLPNSKAKNDKD